MCAKKKTFYNFAITKLSENGNNIKKTNNQKIQER